MTQLATITSKRQLTIPVLVFRQARLREKQKVVVSFERGKLIIEPSIDLVEELAGSIEAPKEFKGLRTDQVIKKAKQEYFKNHDFY